MLYQFGPDAPIVKAIGQAKWPLRAPPGWAPAWMPEISSHFWTMVIIALFVGLVFNFTAWGRHLFAIGGNEQAARMTGVPVDRIKFQAYVFSAFTATVASLLLLGYNGSAINAHGHGLRAAGDRRDRDRRRQPDGRRRHAPTARSSARPCSR